MILFVIHKIVHFILLVLAFAINSCTQQPSDREYKLIGGHCEGCEAVFEFADESLLKDSDTTEGFYTTEDDKLLISGTIFKKDGSTPAENTILYYYHTDENGIYDNRFDEEGWASRHGYLRGWLKTGKSGTYQFATSKPASYPNSKTPAHIHLTVLEENGDYYWIEDIYFSDDPYLTTQETSRINPRTCKSGDIELSPDDGILKGKRDIFLGLNVPGSR